MAYEIAQVRQNSYNNYSEGQDRPARSNKRGELVVSDFWLQMVLDGRMFGFDVGSEDDAVNSTTDIDDQTVWAMCDVPTGTTIIPASAQVAVDTWTTSASVIFMLEADFGKNRYSSGGTAVVPANLRGDYPRASACTVYVNTSTNAGVTVAAKSTLHGKDGSFEFYKYAIEDNWGDAGDTIPERGFHWRAKDSVPVVIQGVGSFLFHFGAGTADATGFGIATYAELPDESVI